MPASCASGWYDFFNNAGLVLSYTITIFFYNPAMLKQFWLIHALNQGKKNNPLAGQ